jgi:23S rRNA pseudouridine1911/1915/1917 synthase
MRINIIYEDKDILVIDKPAGLPAAPLKRTSVNLSASHANSILCRQESIAPNRPTTALEQAAELFLDIRSVVGCNEREFGLLHRLDTATRGLLLIAKNQQTFEFLWQEQTNDRITKHYRAFCVRSDTILSNCPPLPYSHVVQLRRLFSDQCSTAELICVSRFRSWGKNGKEVRPYVSLQADGSTQSIHKKTYAQKKAGKRNYATILSISSIRIEKLLDSIKKYTFIQDNILGSIKNNTVYTVDCVLTRGYRHQVRSHLAWCGLPIIGDELYGSIKAPPLLFFADKIKFTHPASHKPVEFCIG